MNVQHVAAGENAGVGGLSVFVDYRAAGDAVKLDAHVLAQLVLGDKTDGKHERIAGDIFLRAGDRAAVLVDLCNGDALKALLAVNVDNRGAQFERDVEVVEALDDVSRQSARIGHQLADHLDVRTLKGHAARHDKTDITRAEDNDFLAGHIAVNVDIFLRSTCGENAGAAGARDVERTSRTLAAAHCKNDCGGVDLNKTVLFVDCGDDVVVGNGEHHRVGLYDNVGVLNKLDETRGVFGTRKLLAEVVQTEAGMYALLKDTAESLCALEYDYLFNAAFARLERSGHACGASADNGKIIFKH